jgi:hypothetical protein
MSVNRQGRRSRTLLRQAAAGTFVNSSCAAHRSDYFKYKGHRRIFCRLADGGKRYSKEDNCLFVFIYFYIDSSFSTLNSLFYQPERSITFM